MSFFATPVVCYVILYPQPRSATDRYPSFTENPTIKLYLFIGSLQMCNILTVHVVLNLHIQDVDFIWFMSDIL